MICQCVDIDPVRTGPRRVGDPAVTVAHTDDGRSTRCTQRCRGCTQRCRGCTDVAVVAPTLPKRWTTTRAVASGKAGLPPAVRKKLRTPRPDTSPRPSDAPMPIGLPRTTPGSACPMCIDRVSLNHAGCWGPVPRSGAGRSISSPRIGESSVANRRVRRSRLVSDTVRGSQVAPPCAPPNGDPTSAHFQDIHRASARTSSIEPVGASRRHPLAGPRETVCGTRNPVKMRTEPSSGRTGTFNRQFPLADGEPCVQVVRKRGPGRTLGKVPPGHRPRVRVKALFGGADFRGHWWTQLGSRRKGLGVSGRSCTTPVREGPELSIQWNTRCTTKRTPC